MKFVCFWNKSSCQLDPHLETLSSTDDEVITLIIICVMLQSILSFSVFKEVNRAHLQHCIWEQARAENKDQTLKLEMWFPLCSAVRRVYSTYHYFHMPVCLWNHCMGWYCKLIGCISFPALPIPVWFQCKYFHKTYFKLQKWKREWINYKTKLSSYMVNYSK